MRNLTLGLTVGLSVATLGLGLALLSPTFADEVKPDAKKADGCCDEKANAAKKDDCCDADKAKAAKKDDCCDADKAAAKKADGCCDADKAAKKADGCCDADKAAAKPAAKADGCCDADKAAKTDCEGCGQVKGTKAMQCKACEQSDKGACADCQTALKEGKVSFVTISGMSCSNCEGAVAAKLEKMDSVAHYFVTHRFGGAALMVAPGKKVALSEIAAAFKGTKFQVDENTPVAGRFSIACSAQCDEAAKKACGEALAKLGGVTMTCAGNACVLDVAYGSKVTLAALKGAITSDKSKTIDFEVHGPATK